MKMVVVLEAGLRFGGGGGPPFLYNRNSSTWLNQGMQMHVYDIVHFDELVVH